MNVYDQGTDVDKHEKYVKWDGDVEALTALVSSESSYHTNKLRLKQQNNARMASENNY